jgi:hypothetical protein
VSAVVGRGLVTVQFEGTGTMAGPPARGRMLIVGSAEVRMAVEGGVDVVSSAAIWLNERENWSLLSS